MDDLDGENLEGKRVRWDFKNLREGGVDWWTRALLRIAPLRGIRRLSRQLGVDPDVADTANALFANVERVDIVPTRIGMRGFQLIVDQSTSLHFYQDGDHFIYDGFENGAYEKGDVTVFDP